MSEAQVKISVFDDGPIEVTGPVSLVDENGKALQIEPGESFFLCRCGSSSEKPFCDGTHHDCGFVSKLTV